MFWAADNGSLVKTDVIGIREPWTREGLYFFSAIESLYCEEASLLQVSQDVRLFGNEPEVTDACEDEDLDQTRKR